MKHMLLSLSLLSLALAGWEKEDAPMSNDDYYWADGKKVELAVIKNKHYLLFPSKDVSTILESLNQKDADADLSVVFEYDLASIGFDGNTPTEFSDCSFLTVHSEKDLFTETIPELIYAVLGITNIFSVLLKNDQDILKLETLA